MVGVVILNYMNYQETMSCVDSVLLQKTADYRIIVVDNGSANESYSVLKERYYKHPRVRVIRARRNYGFAKGNNIGIRYVRNKFNADFVLLINSDTLMTDENYIEKLLSQYESGIGVIGSEIIMRGGKKQKPFKQCVSFPQTLAQYAVFWNQVYGLRGAQIGVEKSLFSKAYVSVLRGCAFMLTPDFFSKYDGLYPKTFLYWEEVLLYLMCQRAGLKQLYTDATSIFHKECQSSRYLYGNSSTQKLKYFIQSYKYVVWESFKDFLQARVDESRRRRS